MTTRRFRQGDILYYPYRWKHQKSGPVEYPKDRPACIALILRNRLGEDVLTFLPVSDLEPIDPATAIELSPSDLMAMGLLEQQMAFIHLSEANVDDIGNSLTIGPKTRTIGRLPQSTLKRMLKLLRTQLVTKNIELIHRGRRG